MAEVEPSTLANSIMAKLYDVLTNGDDTVPMSEDNFFSWAMPGIPVEPKDFDFLSQGLTGIVKKAAIDEMTPTSPGGGGNGVASSSAAALTAEELEHLRAQDTAQMYVQAENLAYLVDFMPDVTQANNEQFARLSVMNNEGTLSDIYRYILRMSQVAQSELPADIKAKIEKFRSLLNVTVKKKNLIDDTETEVTEPSELTKAYFEKMAAYENAALEYNTHRIDALTAADSRAVHFWSINANTLRNRVRAAMSDWVSSGFKNDYEAISAFISQVMQRDMALLKQEYRDDLEKARLTGLNSGSDFFYTTLIPGGFADAGGWTEFTWSSGDLESHSQSQYSTRRWSASAAGSFLGVFGGAGTRSKTSTHSEYHGTFESDGFRLKFSICQVPIARPWLKPAFLSSKSWRFDQSDPEAKNEVVSDGGSPPRGLIPAYPTAVIAIRDLELSFRHSAGFTDFVEEQRSSSAQGGSCIGFGPICLGGSYSRGSASGSTTRDFGFEFDNKGMRVPGMQIAGFKCHILPKTPDPLPGITNWI